MPAGNTYEAIFTETLASAQASVTFSSIPSTYTDLVVVANCTPSNTSTGSILLTFNGSTASYYSTTRLLGDGTTALSDRATNSASIIVADLKNTISTIIIQIQNYSNSTTYKTALSRGSSTGEYLGAYVGLWRGSTGSSTAAITSLTLNTPGSPHTFNIGSTFSLYGIKAA